MYAIFRTSLVLCIAFAQPSPLELHSLNRPQCSYYYAEVQLYLQRIVLRRRSAVWVIFSAVYAKDQIHRGYLYEPQYAEEELLQMETEQAKIKRGRNTFEIFRRGCCQSDLVTALSHPNS